MSFIFTPRCTGSNNVSRDVFDLRIYANSHRYFVEDMINSNAFYQQSCKLLNLNLIGSYRDGTQDVRR